MGYKEVREEGFPYGEYRLRCSNINELRDFYFVGEGDYILVKIYDLLDCFASVNVSIKEA